jgi:hypothetical protein
MSVADLQAFIVQRLQQVDNTLDLTPGSPYDVQVIQPILRRLGTDPFTVDIGLFIQTLLNQQFPDMPTKEGDAITDLLIKAAVVLWNPIVREISRVAGAQSFADPTTLTTDEAEALGANLFSARNAGNKSTGVVRIYFAQPQNASVTPSNFITDKQGLHYFPTEIQSIRVDEMQLNLEGTLYFFDINTIAEAAGDQYNIGPDQVVTIANLGAAQRITNKLRFRTGTPDESAVDFVDRLDQELTERSLVTQRGIVAQLTAAFSEVTRIQPIGFNDPEMHRDVLTGGGLGPILASGVAMFAEPDGQNAVFTRRIKTTELGVDFTALIGPTQSSGEGFTLTVADAFQAGSLPLVRDIDVLTVVDTQTLDLEDQVLLQSATSIVWTLRKMTLTLSNIPGGILFPDTPAGTIEVPPNQVHIGGATDIYIRGQSFDPATLVLNDIVDDDPLLSGIDLTYTTTSTVTLGDLVLGVDYSVGDSTYTALQQASSENLSLQILDPPNAGNYRILAVVQTPLSSPVLTVDQPIAVVVGTSRWRISSSLFIDLIEPKETKVKGPDLTTVQGLDIVSTISGVDFDTYGVGPNDILRITTGGLIVGDYVVQQVLSPLFTHVQVDRNLPATVNGAQYSIFRANADGGLLPPFVRIDSIDLLDTSSQPVGTIIPYANPIDVESQGFANAARGIKFDLTDGVLGLVTLSMPLVGLAVNTRSINIRWDGQSPFTVTFSGPNPISPATMVAQINAAVLTATAGAVDLLAVVLDNGHRVGLLPVGPNVRVTGGTAMALLYGAMTPVVTSRDVTSLEVRGLGGWAALRPALDSNFDVAQVVDGLQIGFYSLALIGPAFSGDSSEPVPNTPFSSLQNDPLRTRHDFNPEVGRHIQVGSRSLGTARVYFLDPTSFEVDPNTVFTLTNSDGSELNFFPDPTNSYQAIPPLPNGVKPLDGTTGGALPTSPATFQSLSTDFIAKSIQPGDQLSIDFVPLTGTVVLADPVANLNTKTLVVSINGGVDKNIIFIHDAGSIPSTDVTRAGVPAQINAIVGQVICSLTGTNQLQFNPDASVIIRGSSSPSSANGLLGFSVVDGVDQNNDSPDKGNYTIQVVGPGGNPNQLQVTPPFPTDATATSSQQFKVFRAGLQRIVSTSMAVNVDASSANLYFFDVQLVSEGTGDQYNISANLQMTVTGYRSDGYFLTTDDPDLSFSPVEKPKMHISRSILEVGVTDDPANATQLSGQNLQINYERSGLTNDVDNFARSDTERVINESTLARHLTPYFVRFSMTYTGGSKEDVLIPDIQTFITGLFPTDSFEVSDLDHLASVRGARSVDHPISLIAVIHNVDRTVTVERSQNALNTGRLAAFIPDVLLVTRRIA